MPKDLTLRLDPKNISADIKKENRNDHTNICPSCRKPPICKKLNYWKIKPLFPYPLRGKLSTSPSNFNLINKDIRARGLLRTNVGIIKDYVIFTHIKINIKLLVAPTYKPTSHTPKVKHYNFEILKKHSTIDNNNRPIIKCNNHPYIPGRTLEDKMYYPKSRSASLLEYLNTFDITPPNDIDISQQFHPWTSLEEENQCIPSPLANQGTNPHNILTIKLADWAILPAICKDGILWADSYQLLRTVQLKGSQPPDLLQYILNEPDPPHLSINETNALTEHSLKISPNIKGPLQFNLAPIPLLARATEILESILSKTRQLELFTPITGAIKILDEKIPFLLIGGTPYIPWSWSKLLIPPQGDISIHKNPPLRISNWLLLHLNSAAELCNFVLATDNVAPLEDLTRIRDHKDPSRVKNLQMRWESYRNNITKSELKNRIREQIWPPTPPVPQWESRIPQVLRAIIKEQIPGYPRIPKTPYPQQLPHVNTTSNTPHY